MEHDATKDACKQSISTEHNEACGHAMGALDASKTGNHKKAANLHGKAAAMHESAAVEARQNKDFDVADGHDAASAMHRRAAGMHQASIRNVRSTNKRRPAMVLSRQQLIENCSCAEDKAAIANLSDAALLQIYSLNAKAEGSNADTVGDGEDQAGGKGTEDEYEEHRKALVGVTTANQWMASAPPEIRDMLPDMVANYKNRKVALIKKIVSNAKGEAEKANLLKIYSPLKVADLELIANTLAPASVQSEQVPQDFSHLFNFLGQASPAGPGRVDNEAVTQNARDDILPDVGLDMQEISWENDSRNRGRAFDRASFARNAGIPN
jgi:hypothetical protein